MQVFERRQFGQANQEMSDEMVAAMPPEELKALENLREVEMANLGKKPEEFTSIEELLEATAESVTYTILDIVSTSEGQKIACARPAAAEEIEGIYGSAQPTHDEVEEKSGELTEKLGLGPWEAVYFVIYRDGKPSELYFEGVSGD